MALKRRLTAKHRQTWPYPPRTSRGRLRAFWTVLLLLLVAGALIGAGVLIGVSVAVDN